MISFSLAYLLIPFGLIFLLALVFFFFNIFHLKRYAIKSPATTMVMLAYTVSFLVIVLVIGGYIATIDWQKRFELGDLVPTFQASQRL